MWNCPQVNATSDNIDHACFSYDVWVCPFLNVVFVKLQQNIKTWWYFQSQSTYLHICTSNERAFLSSFMILYFLWPNDEGIGKIACTNVMQKVVIDCCITHAINILRPCQNCRHFADIIFKIIFLYAYYCISIKISLNFVPKGPIYNKPALVQVMAWHQIGNKPLYEPMVA